MLDAALKSALITFIVSVSRSIMWIVDCTVEHRSISAKVEEPSPSATITEITLNGKQLLTIKVQLEPTDFSISSIVLGLKSVTA